MLMCGVSGHACVRVTRYSHGCRVLLKFENNLSFSVEGLPVEGWLLVRMRVMFVCCEGCRSSTMGVNLALGRESGIVNVDYSMWWQVSEVSICVSL